MLNLAAENVYNTPDGRMVFDELFEDLRLYDEPRDEITAILHGFGMRVMQKYFGKLRSGAQHRSEITEAIMKVATPEVATENYDGRAGRRSVNRHAR